MSRQTYVVKRQGSDGWVILLAAAILLLYGQSALIAVAFVLAAVLTYELLKRSKPRKEPNEPVEQIYPYETMPLTYPICDTFPYRDHDDGLRGWK